MQNLNYWEKVFQGNNNYYMDLDNPSRKVILDHIGATDSVLDLGCGGGAFRGLWRGAYTGIDYSPTAISLAKERFPDTDFRVGDSRDLSQFSDNSHDVVIMRHFL